MQRKWFVRFTVGVDLNRNFLLEKDFTALKLKDPHRNSNVDIMCLLNPSKVELSVLYWLKAPFHLLKYGFSSIKKATVTGNYHFPGSLFYGGSELQPSHKLVTKFLQSHFDVWSFTSVVMIDVHTVIYTYFKGLGLAAYDTLLVDGRIDDTLIFGSQNQKRIVIADNLNKSAMEGYEDVVGYADYTKLFPLSKGYKLTQEFGTQPAIMVLKALVDENTAYNHCPYDRLEYAEILRDAFYRSGDSKWKIAVISRGVTVYNQVESSM